MSSLQADFGALARDGERGSLVTVVRSEREDVPLGGKLLVRADGATDGTLGSITRLMPPISARLRRTVRRLAA